MYSGTTFRRHSGWMLGVHQRIDRVARRHLQKLIPVTAQFPSSKLILHFEGNNGPDGIKRKSPSIDEPWHFINPRDPSDRQLVSIINDHYKNLVQALKSRNEERSAFEAAWLAHAIVDGLTPAHHYPLSDKIKELWGKPHHERSSVKDKNIIKGTTRRDTISKNWQYWGGGGIFSRHLLFESGVAMSITGHRFRDIGIQKEEVVTRVFNIEELFLSSVKTIDDLSMYDEFGKTGWTRHLANETRQVLMPVIIKTVCLAWYSAFEEARRT
jgi:hypothetical protein